MRFAVSVVQMRMRRRRASKISRILSPTRSMNRLQVSSFGGEALLDAVDDRELGRALLGLLEQALRLVEERARSPSATPMLAATVREQPHLRFAERVLALVVLQRDRCPSARSLPRIGTSIAAEALVGARNATLDPDATVVSRARCSRPSAGVFNQFEPRLSPRTAAASAVITHCRARTRRGSE